MTPVAPKPKESADFYTAFMEKFVKPTLEKGALLGDQFKAVVGVAFVRVSD